MSKNKFGIPGIVFEANPSPTGVIGGGTAQGGQGHNDLPVSWSVWSTDPSYSDLWDFYDELGIANGSPDKYEYFLWWIDCDYTLEQWTAVGNTVDEWNTFSNMMN